MANQFSRRGPPDKIKKGHDDATKDKIRAEMLSKRLEKYAKAKGKAIDKYRMEPAQVQAAKVLIERGKPALQSIEAVHHNPMDQMSEEEIREQVKALITLHPWLIREFAPGPAPSNDPVQAQQSGDTPPDDMTKAA